MLYDKRIGTCPASQRVIARTAVQCVVASTTVQRVIARGTTDRIVQARARQLRGTCAIEVVDAEAARSCCDRRQVHRIATGREVRRPLNLNVCCNGRPRLSKRGRGCRTRTDLQHVQAGVEVRDAVAARVHHERVSTRTAGESIVARTALERVVTTTANERVTKIGARQCGGTTRVGDAESAISSIDGRQIHHIARAGEVDGAVLVVSGGGRGPVCGQRCIDRGAVDVVIANNLQDVRTIAQVGDGLDEGAVMLYDKRIGTCPASQRVIAKTTIQRIFTCATVQRVITGSSIEGVISGSTDH